MGVLKQISDSISKMTRKPNKKEQKQNPHNVNAAGAVISDRKKKRQDMMKEMFPNQ